MGFSNGGFMASDLYLLKETLDFPIKGLCLYMGGISEPQMETTAHTKESDLPKLDLEFMAKHFDGQKVKDKKKILVVTGTLEEQLTSSYNAWRYFVKIGEFVQFDCMEGAPHKYLSESTNRIWNFWKSF